MSGNFKKSDKRWIRPLPERLVNKIAAGEVIERPAAVLKELVENALDAGATQIDIVVEKSGTKLISVTDNGCGIDAAQLEIAFSRHATSKIRDFNDLDNLRSFGFRGEALPSIGSVSRTSMITCTAEDEAGAMIIIEGGVIQGVKPTAASVGSKIEVSDLFYNTPARRKFLKAESTESRHLARTAVAMALSAPEVGFSYKINDRLLFSLERNLIDKKTRTNILLLGDERKELREIETDSNIMKVNGFLSPPDIVRRNQNGLYIFINSRFIKSQTMIHAVRAGYGELLPGGCYPVGAVFLDIDPDKVDVNVHPTKAEVRLSEERQVHDILYQAVKRSFRESAELRSANLNTTLTSNPKPMTSPAPEAISRLRSFQPDRDSVAAQTTLEKLYGPQKSSSDSNQTAPVETAKVTKRGQKPDDGLSKSDAGQFQYLGRISGLYLLFGGEDQLLIIDQHAAHERILYEEFMKSINDGGAVSQNLLFPINIELSPERLILYEESSEALRSVGFVVEPFGGNTVLLTAVPASIAKKSPERTFHLVLEDVENLQKAGYDLKKAVAESMACRAAVMAGDRLTPEEASALLQTLMRCENRHCCPHGRPTVLNISKDELDGKFGRK